MDWGGSSGREGGREGVYTSLPAAEAKQVARLMTMNRQHWWPNFFMSDNTIWLLYLLRNCVHISMLVS